MNALSIWQPWASFIALGIKNVENRGWATRYRGPLLIHAGKTFDEDWEEKLPAVLSHAALAVERWPAYFHLAGHLLAVVVLQGCAEWEDAASPWHEEGQVGWYLRNPRLIRPLPYRGMWGIFDIQGASIEVCDLTALKRSMGYENNASDADTGVPQDRSGAHAP